MSRKDEKVNITEKNISWIRNSKKNISKEKIARKNMACKKKGYKFDAEIKVLLQSAMEAPAPKRKEQFFRTLPREEHRVSNLSFMLSQAAYIQRWVWLISILVLAGAVWGAGFYQQEAVWMISALMPFAAMSALAENSRSTVYNMAELEMASRFSLRSILLARMSIVGLVHLILIAILVPFAGSRQMMSMGRTGVYLLVPYLLTNVLGLYFSRKMHGVGNSYFFLGIASLVSVLGFVARSVAPILYESQQFGWWLAVLVLLLGMTISAYRKILVQTEELLWN